jgi:ATP-dependent DNA ligase
VGRKGSQTAFLYAFDLLDFDGRDLRASTRDVRRAMLTALLQNTGGGIRLIGHAVEQY